MAYKWIDVSVTATLNYGNVYKVAVSIVHTDAAPAIAMPVIIHRDDTWSINYTV